MVENFNEKCYEVLRKVPKGKVVTYKDIANKLNTRAYRAVGNAMNKNRDIPNTPCHRVVGSDGKLTGYALGLNKKREILRKEGIEINNDRVDLKKYSYRL